MTRDPKTDPKPGDILRKNGERREMLKLGSEQDLKEWREWAADTDVIRVASSQ